MISDYLIVFTSRMIKRELSFRPMFPSLLFRIMFPWVIFYKYKDILEITFQLSFFLVMSEILINAINKTEDTGNGKINNRRKKHFHFKTFSLLLAGFSNKSSPSTACNTLKYLFAFLSVPSRMLHHKNPCKRPNTHLSWVLLGNFHFLGHKQSDW